MPHGRPVEKCPADVRRRVLFCRAFSLAAKFVVQFWRLTARGLGLCVGAGAVPAGLIAISHSTQDLRPGLTYVAAPRLGFGGFCSTTLFRIKSSCTDLNACHFKTAFGCEFLSRL
jgi:hypothetical protein